MKKLITVIFLLISAVAAYSQYTPMMAKGYQFKYVKTDSGYVFPVRDTVTTVFKTFGSAVVRPQDSALYIFTNKWNKIGTADSNTFVTYYNLGTRNYLSGAGSTNYLQKRIAGSNLLGNSILQDDGISATIYGNFILTNNSRLMWKNSLGVGEDVLFKYLDDDIYLDNSTALKNISFRTNDGSITSPRLLIKYNGNVGINTTTPLYHLDVNGIIRGSSSIIGITEPLSDSSTKLASTAFVKRNGGGGGTKDSTWYSSVNILSFGAIPGDGLDDAPAIQAAINYAILNGKKNVLFPKGVYNTSSTLQVIAGGSVTPVAGYVSLNLIGESNWWETNVNQGSQIICSFKDKPLLAIQRGEGCVVKGLILTGQFFAPPLNENRWAFYNNTAATFVQDGSRDSTNSPYCAIALDPYTATVLPSTMDNYYRTLGQFYALGSGAGGTGNVIENCLIDGFVIGIANSLNGEMRNCELTTIRNVNFGSGTYRGLKWCIIGTQAQEKVNLVSDCASWGACYGFIALKGGWNGTYGYGVTGGGSTESGNWNVEDINIAGAMVQFCDVSASGWFPCYFNRIYAESLGRIGRFEGAGSTFTNSLVDFEYGNSAGIQNLLVSSNALFQGCTFRYYGETGTMIMANVKATFKDCKFSGAPYAVSTGGVRAKFIGCFNRQGDENKQKGMFIRINRAEDDYSIDNKEQLDVFGLYEVVRLNNRESVFGYAPAIQYYRGNITSTPTITNHSYKFVPVAGDTRSYEVGLSVELYQAGVYGYGRVTAIVGDSVTISYITGNIVSGVSVSAAPIYPNEWRGAFVGDFNAPDTIENVRMDWGYNAADMVGGLFSDPLYNGGVIFKITNYDATSNKFTFHTIPSAPVYSLVSNVWFGNGATKTLYANADYTPTTLPTSTYMPKWTRLITRQGSNVERRFKTTVGGYSSAFTGETRVATTVEE